MHVWCCRNASCSVKAPFHFKALKTRAILSAPEPFVNGGGEKCRIFGFFFSGPVRRGIILLGTKCVPEYGQWGVSGHAEACVAGICIFRRGFPVRLLPFGRCCTGRRRRAVFLCGGFAALAQDGAVVPGGAVRRVRPLRRFSLVRSVQRHGL